MARVFVGHASRGYHAFVAVTPRAVALALAGRGRRRVQQGVFATAIAAASGAPHVMAWATSVTVATRAASRERRERRRGGRARRGECPAASRGGVTANRAGRRCATSRRVVGHEDRDPALRRDRGQDAQRVARHVRRPRRHAERARRAWTRPRGPRSMIVPWLKSGAAPAYRPAMDALTAFGLFA